MSKTTFTVDRENLEVRMERIIDAPRERIFKAVTDAEQIPKWWGPRGLTTTVDKLDVRVGGAWRFIHKDADGQEYAFNGVYKEIIKPELLVYTFEFEPMAGHIMEETVRLEELPEGKTRLTTHSAFSNIEDLDGMVNTGMEKGSVESQDRLAELVEK